MEAFGFLKKHRKLAAGAGAALAVGGVASVDQAIEHHPSDAAAEKAFDASHHMTSAETNISKATSSSESAPTVTLPHATEVSNDDIAKALQQPNDLDAKQ